MQDKVRDGTSSRGDQSKRAKITNEMARNIYASKGDGTQKQRAERYGVTVHIVAHIDRGTSWKHVTQADASALPLDLLRQRGGGGSKGTARSIAGTATGCRSGLDLGNGRFPRLSFCGKAALCF